MTFLTTTKIRDFNIRNSLNESEKWDDKNKQQILLRILKEVILNDGLEKLDAKDRIYRRIDLFQEIINEHLEKKKLNVDSDLDLKLFKINHKNHYH